MQEVMLFLRRRQGGNLTGNVIKSTPGGQVEMIREELGVNIKTTSKETHNLG
jgi:hypothetical protein